MITSTLSFEQAEVVVSKYGHVLSSTKPSIYGLPISQLPYDKEEIKVAIQTLLIALEGNNNKIQEGLIQAYVYLAQFIDDDKVKIAESGRVILEADDSGKPSKDANNSDTDDLELANQAVQTINGIKSDMEALMNEIQLIIS